MIDLDVILLVGAVVLIVAILAARLGSGFGLPSLLLFLGLGDDVESEGYDRTDMELPAAQIELLEEVRAASPNVVVVLSNGSAVRLPAAVRGSRAVLETWLLGQAGGPVRRPMLDLTAAAASVQGSSI